MENRGGDIDIDEPGCADQTRPQTETLGTKYVEMEEIDFCPYSPSPEEKAFFEAVRSGNSAEVEELINVKHVDVDCTNVDGETALQIAVKREAFDMVQTLLRNKADIGAALFEAVRNNSLQYVRILVAHDSRHRKNTAVKTLGKLSATQHRSRSENFEEFLTPLVLAVLNGNYEIVEFFVSKGYRVDHPNTQKPQSETGSMVRLKDSLFKLNTYKALASPLYISQTFLHENRERKELNKKSSSYKANDPLYRSIVLRRKLKKLGHSENEFREDYLALSAQCENFAVSLLDECRNLEEIAAVMDVPEAETLNGKIQLRQKEHRLRVLNLAIKYRNRKVRVLFNFLPIFFIFYFLSQEERPFFCQERETFYSRKEIMKNKEQRSAVKIII